MMRPKRFRPGQQYKRYTISRKIAKTDARGRTTYSKTACPVGELYGAISVCSPKEREQWNQLGHPVTHKIIVEGNCIARADDIVERNGRKFYVESNKNSGALDMFNVLWCRELNGVGEDGNKCIKST